METSAPIPFRPFDSHGTLRIYRRHLPHWRQDGATYFVTFRLADSVPRCVVEGWQEERRVWLVAHGLSDDLPDDIWQERYRAVAEAERTAFEREETRKLLVELDKCHGACVLREPAESGKVADALRFFDGARLRCGDFVVMPNHVHWLVQPRLGVELEDVLHSVKSFTARRVSHDRRGAGTLWQKENYDRIVRNRVELDRTCTYIADNPIRAGVFAQHAPTFAALWVDT